MNVRPDGLRSRIIDDSHISMLDFQLDRSALESYTVKENGVNLSLGVDAAFSKLARGLRTSKRVEFLLTSAIETGEMKMIFEGFRAVEHTLAFEITDSAAPPVPNVDFKSRMRLSASLLCETLEDIRIVSERVKITSTQNGFEFMAISDKSKARSLIPSRSRQIYGFSSEVDCEAEYDVDRITSFLDSMGPGVVSIEFSTHAPIRIYEDIVSGSHDLGYVAMYLASTVRE